MPTAEARPKHRLGRKPGAWTHLTPEALRAFREEHKLSRDRLADLLGVSRTSIQNWETLELPPSPKTQQRLAELLRAGPGAIPPPRKAPSLWDAPRPQRTDAGVLLATGAIVAAWARTHTLSQDELLALIQTVREALTS